MSQSVDLQTLADLLMLDPRRIQQLAKEGVVVKAARGEYELVPSIQGYINSLKESGNQEIFEQKTRLTKARAEREEFTVKKLQGELVGKNDVIENWSLMIANCRSLILAIPNKIAARVRSTKTDAEAQKIIQNELWQALRELKETEVVVQKTD